MPLFNRGNHETTPPTEATPSLEIGEATERLVGAAHQLLQAVRAAKETERSARRIYQAAVAQPWLQEYDAACAALLDFASVRARDIEDAARLLSENKGHLVNLEIIGQFKRLYLAADDLRRGRPRDEPRGVHSFLNRMRGHGGLGNEADALIGEVLGPEPVIRTLVDEAVGRWSYEVLDRLPAGAVVQVGYGARGLIHEHPVIAARQQAEPQEVAVST